MKYLVRTVSVLVLAAILALTLVSCSDKTENEGSATTPATDTPAVTGGETTAPKQDNLPEGLNFGQKEIRVISRDSDWVRGEIYIGEITADLINDAIYNRDKAVEDRLGVNIVSKEITGGNYAVSEAIRTSVKAGTDDYDILANSVYSTIMYTGENLFHNLYDCQYLDLSQPYWSQGFNEAASVGNAQYMCTGAIALTLYRYMFVTFFNKNMFEARNIGNMYKVVEDGKWTLDYQYMVASNFYYDSNGNGISDVSDRYGFLTTNQAYIDAYWSSCKLPILTKDADNFYVYSLDTDRMVRAVDKILNLWYKCPGSFIVTSASDSEDQIAGASALSEGRAAMVTLRLVSVESEYLRNMIDPYGIIPIPKLEESQEKYYTYLHDQFTALAIVSTVGDEKLEMLGAFLEAMASESYKTLVPTYYEIALKSRYARDEESGKMLDLIYSSIYIDAGVLYTKNLASVHQQLRNIVKSQSNIVISTYSKLNKIIETQLTAMNKGIAAIQN